MKELLVLTAGCLIGYVAICGLAYCLARASLAWEAWRG